MLPLIQELSEQVGDLQNKLNKLKGLYPVIKKPRVRALENMEAGSKLKGWLKANEAAVKVAEEFGLDTVRPEIQALVTSIVKSILDANIKV